MLDQVYEAVVSPEGTIADRPGEACFARFHGELVRSVKGEQRTVVEVGGQQLPHGLFGVVLGCVALQL